MIVESLGRGSKGRGTGQMGMRPDLTVRGSWEKVMWEGRGGQGRKGQWD